jgi:hypothetical protein
MSYLDTLDVQQDEMLDEDSLTFYQVWGLQQCCIILCLALKIAKEKMNGITWQQCCKEAIGRVFSSNGHVSYLKGMNNDAMVSLFSFQTEIHKGPVKNATYLHSYSKILRSALPCNNTDVSILLT